MTKRELKKAIESVIISNMDALDNEPISVLQAENLYRSILQDLDFMHDSWWKLHFPNCHIAVSVQFHAGKEPSIVVTWSHNAKTHIEEEMIFLFHPSRLENDIDYDEAYKRAMSII